MFLGFVIKFYLMERSLIASQDGSLSRRNWSRLKIISALSCSNERVCLQKLLIKLSFLLWGLQLFEHIFLDFCLVESF